MIDDTSSAFDHPENRARALATAPRDRISLRDHVVSVEIGAFQAERGVTQRLAFDIVVDLRPQPPAGDDVDRILSYDRLTEAVAAELAAERLNLLETLAEGVAARILAEPRAERVFVRIQKLDRGPGALGVEIMREGSALPRPASPSPQPRLLLVGADVALGPWLEPLLADAAPLVVCPSPLAPAPRSADPAAQLRIDLLALDQAAWALAAMHPGLAVRDSRTEIDWALRQGAPTVWAPARMVADAVEPPAGTDPAVLVDWLATRLSAREILVAGAAAPDTALPLRVIAIDPAPGA